MSTSDSYRSYAADCVRKAETAGSPEEKNVLLNVALAWIRLAHQKQAIAEKAASAPVDLDAGDAPADTGIATKIVKLEEKRPAPVA